MLRPGRAEPVIRIAVRVAIILGCAALGAFLAVLVPHAILYDGPANSFDASFGRIFGAMMVGFLVGAGLGVVATSQIGRSSLALEARLAHSLVAVIAAVLVCGFAALMLSG